MALVVTNNAGSGPGIAATRPVYSASGGRGLKVVTGTMAFDNSYPAGGEATTDISGLFTELLHVKIDPQAGYSFAYDYTNNKVQAYQFATRYGGVTLNPASLATDVTANETVTVTGVATTDDIICLPPDDLETGLVVQKAWVSSANTVTVRLSNVSAGTIDAASKATWAFIAIPQSGVLKEVKASTDLSALTAVRFMAIGY